MNQNNYDIGMSHYESGSYLDAVSYLTLAADNGHLSAQIHLAWMYAGTEGVKNYELATKYYTLAANQGDVYAKYELAQLHEDGYGSQAIELYTEVVAIDDERYAPLAKAKLVLNKKHVNVFESHKGAIDIEFSMENAESDVLLKDMTIISVFENRKTDEEVQEVFETYDVDETTKGVRVKEGAVLDHEETGTYYLRFAHGDDEYTHFTVNVSEDHPQLDVV
ncbi:MAG: tetratricopeptide repeat protein [Candidatus Puniceispirillales bacterium WSBS_2018_MAG_OTU23]